MHVPVCVEHYRKNKNRKQPQKERDVMNIRACIGYLFCSFEIFNKIRVKYDMTMVNSERTGLEKSKRFTKY